MTGSGGAQPFRVGSSGVGFVDDRHQAVLPHEVRHLEVGVHPALAADISSWRRPRLSGTETRDLGLRQRVRTRGVQVVDTDVDDPPHSVPRVAGVPTSLLGAAGTTLTAVAGCFLIDIPVDAVDGSTTHLEDRCDRPLRDAATGLDPPMPSCQRYPCARVRRSPQRRLRGRRRSRPPPRPAGQTAGLRQRVRLPARPAGRRLEHPPLPTHFDTTQAAIRRAITDHQRHLVTPSGTALSRR